MMLDKFYPEQIFKAVEKAKNTVSILSNKLKNGTISDNEREKLQKAIEFLEAFNEDYENNKYKYFVPIGKMEKFIQAVASPDFFIVLLSAANGIGKTTTSVVLLASLVWGTPNKYFDYPMFRNWTFPKRIRIVSDPTVVMTNLIPAIKEWFPKGRWTGKKLGRKHISWIESDTGWIIDIMTFDQDVEKFEGVNLGLFWADEPPPERIYSALVSRLRTGGKGFITATPLDSAGWFDKAFYRNSKALYVKEVHTINTNFKGQINSSRIAIINAGMEDACKVHGVRGFLDHNMIEIQKQTIDPDEILPRIYGKPITRSGLVFKKFDRGVHVIKPFRIDPDNFTVYMAVDYHHKEPLAALWLAVSKDGFFYVVDELFYDVSIADFAQKIIDLENKRNYRIIKRIIDPLAQAKTTREATEYSPLVLFQEHGLYFVPGQKKREQAITLINEALTYVKSSKSDKFVKFPRLYVFDRCTKLIEEFETWRYPTRRRRANEGSRRNLKPIDADDHMIENLGRILLERPVYISPSGFTYLNNVEKRLKMKKYIAKRYMGV